MPTLQEALKRIEESPLRKVKEALAKEPMAETNMQKDPVFEDPKAQETELCD